MKNSKYQASSLVDIEHIKNSETELIYVIPRVHNPFPSVLKTVNKRNKLWEMKEKNNQKKRE